VVRTIAAIAAAAINVVCTASATGRPDAAKTAPRPAAPAAPPKARKNAVVEVATPIRERSTQFCTATTSSCEVRPKPRAEDHEAGDHEPGRRGRSGERQGRQRGGHYGGAEHRQATQPAGLRDAAAGDRGRGGHPDGHGGQEQPGRGGRDAGRHLQQHGHEHDHREQGCVQEQAGSGDADRRRREHRQRHHRVGGAPLADRERRARRDGQRHAARRTSKLSEEETAQLAELLEKPQAGLDPAGE
jgi:hypothetical protein